MRDEIKKTLQIFFDGERKKDPSSVLPPPPPLLPPPTYVRVASISSTQLHEPLLARQRQSDFDFKTEKKEDELNFSF